METMNDTLKMILSRRSVRSYRPDPVSDGILDGLMRAAFAAPSAMAQRANHFIIVTGETLIHLASESPHTPKGSPAAVVICVDESRLKVPHLGTVDAAAATENILLAAHAAGLASVWSAVMPSSEAHYREVLGLPSHVRPFAIVPIGYSDERPEQTDRYDPERVHQNGW